MKIVGIYSITNLKDGKIYIGSTKNSERRFYYHINYLRNNKHSNSHLQRAYNRDGEENFIYNLIEKCNEDELINREEYYIEKLRSCDENIGYNMNPKADRPPSWEGKKHSEETKKKISEYNKGRIISEYGKKRASEVHKGKKLSENQLKFLKEKNKGTGNPMYGKSVYDVWVNKYGKEEADKRYDDWVEKLRNSMKGENNPI